MRRLLYLFAVALVVLLVAAHPPPAVVAHSSPTPAFTTPAQASAQLTGIAGEELKRTQKFWQNGSGAYATASIPVTFPSNFTAGNWSSITSFAETFYPTATGGYYPQVNETQSGTVLANTTASLPFTITPTLSATPVTQKVPELWSAANSPAPIAAYTVTTLAVQSIAFVYNTPLNWTANSSSTYTATYGVAAYRGYWLNQSQVYIPFPSLPTGVNWSTVKVLLNGSTYSNFQVVTGGVYVNVATVGPGYTASLSVRFTVLPATSGAAPTLIVSTYFALNATTDQLNTSWTNQMNVPYAGEYIIQTNFPFVIDPNSVVVVAGLRTLPSGGWQISGNTITIGPQVVTVNAGSAVSFYVNFKFVNQPAAYHLTAGSVAFPSGAGVVTWGELALAGWLLAGVGAAMAWLFSTQRKRSTGVRWDSDHRLAVTLTVVAVFLFAFWFYLEVQAGVTL